MSLYIASLNSGSNGNAYYIGNNKEAILVDAGLSAKETEKRMKSLGLRMDAIKAIFISHEHGDHIKGVEGLLAKYNYPLYITPKTLQKSRLRIADGSWMSFQAHIPTVIGDLNIVAFPKNHDAIDPNSFIVYNNSLTVGVFTDIGSPCEYVKNYLAKCNAVFMEANYDTEMLDKGRYTAHLKQRIKGGEGHLSNHQAAELIRLYKSEKLSHVLLSHLSQDNNHPDVALLAFKELSQQLHVSVASRMQATGIYELTPYKNSAKSRVIRHKTSVQISLF